MPNSHDFLLSIFAEFNRKRIFAGHSTRLTVSLALLLMLVGYSAAATPDRITQPVDASRTRAVAGNVHHLAQPQYDQGAADPRTPMAYMVFLVKPSASQQAELVQLLSDQQNPASPQYHKWLTPEAFGARFGLSEGDLAKVAGWLKSEGFAVDHQARGRNWFAFSGAAAQTAHAFHTSIDRYVTGGETHFANAGEPSVPEALADVAGGFLGLNNFPMQPAVRVAQPNYNTGSSHYLAPADFATIYDLAPLYQEGLDGTGQSIAVVGESDVLLSDLSAFRTRYGLPANPPTYVLYDGVDPGYNGAELEGALDLEWSGAIAPKATIFYVYGASAITAMAVAIDLDLAPIVSASYGLCEVNFAPAGYEPLAQQANAQGITLLASSGDAGAAGCDQQQFEPLATRGLAVQFPAAMPEVTGIGGSQFVEGTGTYWATGNSSTFGSALSYIPEAAWNESSSSGLGASG
jgi:subtilase family serine protease